MHKDFQMLWKFLSGQCISGASLNFVLQQRSHAGFHSLHQAVILSAFQVHMNRRNENGELCILLFHTWSILLFRHMCNDNCSFCDIKVASLCCPPGLVSLLRSFDDSVKSLFKNSLGCALPVYLCVASFRLVSHWSETLLFISINMTLHCSI